MQWVSSVEFIISKLLPIFSIKMGSIELLIDLLVWTTEGTREVLGFYDSLFNCSMLFGTKVESVTLLRVLVGIVADETIEGIFCFYNGWVFWTITVLIE